MTFRNDAQFNTKQVRRGGGGRGVAVGGGSLLALLATFLIFQFTGINIGPLLNGGQAAPADPGTEITGCTGADANDPANIDCRMEGGTQSLSDFWSANVSGGYQDPDVMLFSGSVQSGCGAATSDTGPFYCPADNTIYIDTTFFEDLRTRFGAQGGNLAEMYVLAHEWGHHIQNLTGELRQMNPRDTGPTSSMVRGELQADCYAGAWISGATGARSNGAAPVMESVSQEQLGQAIDAAGVIGDDRIQKDHTGRVNPDAWSHGSSQQRQTWLMRGYEGGIGACNTWQASEQDILSER